MWHNAASENWLVVKIQQDSRILYFAWARASKLQADTRETVIPCTGVPHGSVSGGDARTKIPVPVR